MARPVLGRAPHLAGAQVSWGVTIRATAPITINLPCPYCNGVHTGRHDVSNVAARADALRQIAVCSLKPQAETPKPTKKQKTKEKK